MTCRAGFLTTMPGSTRQGSLNSAGSQRAADNRFDIHALQMVAYWTAGGDRYTSPDTRSVHPDDQPTDCPIAKIGPAGTLPPEICARIPSSHLVKTAPWAAVSGLVTCSHGGRIIAGTHLDTPNRPRRVPQGPMQTRKGARSS